MSENLETTAEMDELSRLLDTMNSGQQPQSADKETAELLAVAALIKNAGIPVRPPQHILDQTVERALAGLQSSKPKPSRAWLYSGALSAAAAVVLIISLNLMPSLTPKVPPVPPPTTGSELQSASRELPVKQQSPIVSETAPDEPEKKPADTAEKIAPGAEKQTSPGKPAVQTGVVSQIKETEQPRPSGAAKNPPVRAEKAPMLSEAKSAYEAFSVPPGSPENRPSALTALSLPGQAPDTIVTDTDRGMVRQVFNKGTPQEFIITQRLRVKEPTQSKSLAPAITESEAKPGVVNKVTVSIYDQEVTIEGRKTRQELLQLAYALTQQK